MSELPHYIQSTDPLEASNTVVTADTTLYTSTGDYLSYVAVNDPYNLTADNTQVPAGTTRYTAAGGVLLPWIFDPTSLRNPGTRLLEIPVVNPPCSLSVDLPGRTVRLCFTYEDEEGTWIMDVSDDGDAPLAHGVPLVTGLNLLEPYSYLGFGTRMFVLWRGGDPSDVPGFADLGTAAGLFFEVAA